MQFGLEAMNQLIKLKKTGHCEVSGDLINLCNYTGYRGDIPMSDLTILELLCDNIDIANYVTPEQIRLAIVRHDPDDELDYATLLPYCDHISTIYYLIYKWSDISNMNDSEFKEIAERIIDINPDENAGFICGFIKLILDLGNFPDTTRVIYHLISKQC